MLLTKKFILKPTKTQCIILGHFTYVASKLFNVGNYERKEYRNLGFDKEPDWYEQKKEFNQKLHSLPVDKIYHCLEYKLIKKGVTLIKQNEAFTSQCSPTSKEVSSEYADKNNRIYRGLYQDGNAIYNADSVGAFNILRKHYQENNISRNLNYKCLSNPTKISISVTSSPYKEEVGVLGGDHPDIYALKRALDSMLGNSIAE